eukprot:gene5397-5935_t
MTTGCRWSTSGCKAGEKSDKPSTQDDSRDLDWTLSDIDWRGVFQEEGEERSIDRDDSVTKEIPSSPSSSSSLSAPSSSQQHRLHPVVTATTGGLIMNGAGYDNLFLQCEDVDLTLPSKRHGLDNLIRRFELCRDSIPDSAILLKHSYINRQIDQAGSRVVMKITAHATVVKHGVVAVVGLDQKRHLVPSFMVDEFVRAGTVDIDHMSLEKHPPDAQPISLDISGETILWLDNNHRIYCIESLGKVESLYRN